MANMLSAVDVQEHLASRLRTARLEANLTQSGLAKRSGVSLGSLKRFEQTGEISLRGFISLAYALRLESGLMDALEPQKTQTMDQILEHNNSRKRQRGHRQ